MSILVLSLPSSNWANMMNQLPRSLSASSALVITIPTSKTWVRQDMMNLSAERQRRKIKSVCSLCCSDKMLISSPMFLLHPLFPPPLYLGLLAAEGRYRQPRISAVFLNKYHKLTKTLYLSRHFRTFSNTNSRTQ